MSLTHHASGNETPPRQPRRTTRCDRSDQPRRRTGSGTFDDAGLLVCVSTGNCGAPGRDEPPGSASGTPTPRRYRCPIAAPNAARAVIGLLEYRNGSGAVNENGGISHPLGAAARTVRGPGWTDSVPSGDSERTAVL